MQGKRELSLNLANELLLMCFVFSSYTGNLTFTLRNGLKMTIPNHQLLTPGGRIDDNGVLTDDPSIRELQIQDHGPGNIKMPRLGFTLLTAAILTVNHESNRFSLTVANPTNDEADLQPILNGDDTCEPGQPEEAEPSSGSSSGMSPGAKAGVAIGVIGAVGALAGIGFLLIRRRKQTEAKQAAAHASAAAAEAAASRGPDYPDPTPARPAPATQAWGAPMGDQAKTEPPMTYYGPPTYPWTGGYGANGGYVAEMSATDSKEDYYRGDTSASSRSVAELQSSEHGAASEMLADDQAIVAELAADEVKLATEEYIRKGLPATPKTPMGLPAHPKKPSVSKK